MSTTIASQLKALRSSLRVEAEPTKRPFTRPSIVYNLKEAADIDVEAIFSIAQQGLDSLIDYDVRFENYKRTLFSEKSRELDRELLGTEENSKIDSSIASYMRLLAGYLNLASALMTLEYLFRRYKIHVYNMDELLLCALPYHDTQDFVRIVQLLELGNGRWGFLRGVKESGAPPPRKVLVQQCVRDKGVLEAICNYALPTKQFRHSDLLVDFCTSIVIEALDASPTLDSDTVKRVIPFVFSGLNPKLKAGARHKEDAMMIICFLAKKATLATKLIHNLIMFVARAAQQDANESGDLPWLCQSAMTIISLVELQPIQTLPRACLKILNEIRDFTRVLDVLSKEFNIQKFLNVYMEALVDNSSDDTCCIALIKTIETVHVKVLVLSVVFKVLNACIKLSQGFENSKVHESGKWAKPILLTLNKHYPNELHEAVQKFLEDSKINSIQDTLCVVLDGQLDLPTEVSCSKVWFNLEHPKAEIRRMTLSALVDAKAIESQSLVNVEEAMLRRLNDGDLYVVEAALSVDGLAKIVNASNLVKAFQAILSRCINILMRDTGITSQAFNVALLCLKRSTVNLTDHWTEISEGLATMVFPLLLILPKTWMLNIKALNLVQQINWPLFSKLHDVHDLISIMNVKEFEPTSFTSINVKIVNALAESFVLQPGDYISWLIDCCCNFNYTKPLSLLVILQSFVLQKEDFSGLSMLYEICVPVLKSEWNKMEDDAIFSGKLAVGKLNIISCEVVDMLFDSKCDYDKANSTILAYIFWSILESLTTISVNETMADFEGWLMILQDLFVIFASSSLKHAHEEHLQYLVMKSSISPVRFLSKFLTDSGSSMAVELFSLNSFVKFCSLSTSTKGGLSSKRQMELLFGLPLLLVPLSTDHQDVRILALNCVEELYNLWSKISFENYGNDIVLEPFFGDFMKLIIDHGKLVSSDMNLLGSLLKSIFISTDCLLAPQNIGKRFDQHAKEEILHFILNVSLKFPPYGKHMVLSLLDGVGNVLLHVEEVKIFLLELLKRRNQRLVGATRTCQPSLSMIEVDTLCLLLKNCVSLPSSPQVGDVIADVVLLSLQVNNASTEDPAIILPCVTVLKKLTSDLYRYLKTDMQDEIFQYLIILFRHDASDIQNAARDALLRLNVSFSTVSRLLHSIVSQECFLLSSLKRIKRKKATKGKEFQLCHGLSVEGESLLFFLNSLLDILLQKKDIESRVYLVEPLFKLLGEIVRNNWFIKLANEDQLVEEYSSGILQITGLIYDIPQTILMILLDICASLSVDDNIKDLQLDKFDVHLLVECARSAKDIATRNHVFILLSSITGLSPGLVIDHIVEIFTVVGESAIVQSDSQSQHVLENLISTIVPHWLLKTNDMKKLIQIFVEMLPEIAEHRRLTLMVCLLRTLGGKESLGALLILLFRSLAMKLNKDNCDEIVHASKIKAFLPREEWEYVFALQVCGQYSCTIWLSSLVILLKETRLTFLHHENTNELALAIEFLLQKLQDTELSFMLESKEDSNLLQDTLETLMEEAVSLLVLVSFRTKILNTTSSVRKELKGRMQTVLLTVTSIMSPCAYFKAITLLLGHADQNLKKKALVILCETVQGYDMVRCQGKMLQKHFGKFRTGHDMDEAAWEYFNKMCLEIVRLIDNGTCSSVDSLDTSVKLSAISALEVLARIFSSYNAIFTTCLSSVAKYIDSDDLAVASSCLRCTGALINVLGPKAVFALPCVIEHLLNKCHKVSSCSSEKFEHLVKIGTDRFFRNKESLLFSILVALEAAVEKLGSFLNPFLEDIIEVMVLHSEYVSETNMKLKLKSDLVRRLITQKIPVRLSLAPLLKINAEAIKCGESSLCVAFEMLASIVSTMDRSTVRSYYARIFEHCIRALDLRSLHLSSLKNINMVEEGVINAMIVLSMKLTESMFKPIFIQCLEWAESGSNKSESSNQNLDRPISFFKLVSKLVEHHRSLFVPYFKYLLEICTRYLPDSQDPCSSNSSRKRKKAKVSLADSNIETKVYLSSSQWHLRTLILSSLYKCFLYDNGGVKFLDSSNFQVLLKPIVSQLLVEPPATLESGLPSVKEFDDILVSCLGQMALTAGSDLLWKPLNHEVLMRTRSGEHRAQILSLRVINFLLKHLKEEYLFLLPETIPFLGELLEDSKLPVRTMAQEVIKELETLSGEDLQQYLS